LIPEVYFLSFALIFNFRFLVLVLRLYILNRWSFLLQRLIIFVNLLVHIFLFRNFFSSSTSDLDLTAIFQPWVVIFLLSYCNCYQLYFLIPHPSLLTFLILFNFQSRYLTCYSTLFLRFSIFLLRFLSLSTLWFLLLLFKYLISCSYFDPNLYISFSPIFTRFTLFLCRLLSSYTFWFLMILFWYLVSCKFFALDLGSLVQQWSINFPLFSCDCYHFKLCYPSCFSSGICSFIKLSIKICNLLFKCSPSVLYFSAAFVIT
jgi:hypothetical protein